MAVHRRRVQYGSFATRFRAVQVSETHLVACGFIKCKKKNLFQSNIMFLAIPSAVSAFGHTPADSPGCLQFSLESDPKKLGKILGARESCCRLWRKVFERETQPRIYIINRSLPERDVIANRPYTGTYLFVTCISVLLQRLTASWQWRQWWGHQNFDIFVVVLYNT